MVWHGAAGTISDGVVSGNYQEYIDQGNVHLMLADIGKGVVVGGALGGAVGGAISSAVSSSIAEVGGEVGGVIQRTAREGVSELTDVATALIQGSGRAAGAAARNLIESVTGSVLSIEQPIPELDDEPPPLSADEEGIDTAIIPEHNFFTFRDDGKGLFIKMHVQYILHGQEFTIIKKSRELFTLPPRARSITVHFEAARGPKYSIIKKWNRKKKDWVVPTEPHIFYYDYPPCRRFIIDGIPFYEKVVSIQKEDNLEVEDDEHFKS